jgi:hypothetical protein
LYQFVARGGLSHSASPRTAYLVGGICSVISYVALKSLFIRGLALCVVVAAVLYVFDYLIVKYRTAHGEAGMGTVTVYLASAMKNGRVELYYQNPQAIACVHSLFPHMGYTPCWYLSRSPVKVIS